MIAWTILAVAERHQTAALLGLAAICYVPLIVFGYGANEDSTRIAETGRLFIATGVYTPSRYPGFPVHEIPAAVLAHFGGSLLSNAGTVVMALLSVHAFLALLSHYNIPNRAILTLALIGNPVFWTTATYTIDYVWSLALLLVGFNLLQQRRYLWGCVALGLATGSRVSSLGFAIALLGYQFATAKGDRARLGRCVPVVILIGVLAHAPTIHRFGVLRLYFGDWNAADYLANFVFGNMMLVGPQAMLGLMLIAVALVRSPAREFIVAELQPLAWLCCVIILGYEILFLLAPIQVGYLLPALPPLLMLLGIVLRDRRRILLLWVMLSTSAACMSINPISVTGNVHRVESALPPVVALLGPDLVHGRSTVVSSGLFVRWGYVVADAAARIAYERINQPP